MYAIWKYSPQFFFHALIICGQEKLRVGFMGYGLLHPLYKDIQSTFPNCIKMVRASNVHPHEIITHYLLGFITQVLSKSDRIRSNICSLFLD